MDELYLADNFENFKTLNFLVGQTSDVKRNVGLVFGQEIPEDFSTKYQLKISTIQLPTTQNYENLKKSLKITDHTIIYELDSNIFQNLQNLEYLIKFFKIAKIESDYDSDHANNRLEKPEKSDWQTTITLIQENSKLYYLITSGFLGGNFRKLLILNVVLFILIYVSSRVLDLASFLLFFSYLIFIFQKDFMLETGAVLTHELDKFKNTMINQFKFINSINK